MLSYQIFFAFIVFIFDSSILFPQTDCPRYGYLEEFSNPENPNYEKKLKEYDNCIKKNLGKYRTFDQDDPKLVEVIEKCKELEPPEREYIYPSQIMYRLAQNLSEQNFHMLMDTKQTQPEYIFTGYYEIDLDEIGEGGEPIISRLHIDLLYNGDYRELVKSWETVKSKNIVSGHLNMMFDNPHSLIRNERPISKLLKEFEKPPVTFKLEAEKDEVNISEQIKIELSEFRDEKGNQSREFNRILVQVLEGKIMNGTSSNFNKDYKVFEIGNGLVTVEYQAPNKCDVTKDMINVYSGCEIIGGLEKTTVKDKINEKELEIICSEGYVEYNHEIVVANPGYNETIKVSGSIPFKMKKPKDKQKEPPKVEGKGSVNVSINGTTPICTMSGGTNISVNLSGEIKTEKEGDYLLIDLDEDWNKTIPWKWNCTGVSFDKERNFYSQKDDFNGLKFKREDGYEIKESFSNVGMEGKYHWTLHLGK